MNLFQAMRKMLLLVTVVLLGACATKHASPSDRVGRSAAKHPSASDRADGSATKHLSASDQVGWKWLIQYSYLEPAKDGSNMKIHVQMHDNGSVEYIHHGPPPAAGAAWWRRIHVTPKEAESVKRQIEMILAGLKDDNQQSTKASRALGAGIIIRTAEELVEAWGDDKYGDAHKQVQKVFKNWRALDDDTHRKIQAVMKQFNDEAGKLPWKWE